MTSEELRRRAIEMRTRLGLSGRVKVEFSALVEDAISVGREAALAECQTCGCTGVMTVDEGEGGPPPHEEVCGECNGTGISAFGQMLRDARAGGEAAAAFLPVMWDVVNALESRGDPMASKLGDAGLALKAALERGS